MKVFRTFLKFVGFALIGLFLAAILLPFVFKDKLVTFLKENINKNVNAVVDFHDADLSFIKSFPDLEVSIDSLSVSGMDEFDGILLYKADKTSLDISIPSLFGDKKIPVINSIIMQRPDINIVILDSARVNYLITKPSSDQAGTPYHLQLDAYSIEDGKITYQDNTMQLYTVLSHVDHQGKGDFTQDVFDLETTTSVKDLNVKYAGTKYLNSATANLNARININLPENKYTLKNNVIKINELDATGDGSVQLKGDDVITDVKFRTASEEFRALLSMIPYAYTKDFKDVKTSGKAGFNGWVKGIYNERKNQMLAFDIHVKIDKGYVKYPGLAQDIKDINADIQLKASRADYKDMSANIPLLNMKIGGDPISGSLVANNLTGDQKLEGHLKGNLNLTNIAASLPLSDVDVLKGHLHCDVNFKAKMSDINNENYSAINFEGKADADDVLYQSKGMPAIKITHATATASPKAIHYNGEMMMLGKSDLSVIADIDNPLAFFSSEKNVKVNITGTSAFFDMNEWMSGGRSPNENKLNEQAPLAVDENLIKNASVVMKLNVAKLMVNAYQLDKVVLDANASANALKINDFASILDGNDIKIEGRVVNAYDYFFNGGTIDGDLEFNSNKFDANKFLTNSNTNVSGDDMQVIPVPDKVRMKIKTNIKDLTYTNLNLKNFNGDLEVKNREVLLKNLVTQTLGGNIAMEGLYNTVDLSKPDFSIKMDLSKIKFADAMSKFEMLKKAAPIAAYIDGMFNTTLVMKGKLGSQMTPDLSSLDASGFLETLSGTLKGFNPISELGEKLGVKELKDLNLTNTKNWFEIVKGFVELKEYKKNFKGIDMAISGKHGFGKDMDYNIDLVMPRELLKKNKITSTAETGLSILEKEASKLGINIDQGPNVFLNVKMTGNIKKPVFKITPKTSQGSSVKDAIENKVSETAASIKDSIQKEIKKKETELRDTITKRANEELEKAKSKIETAADKAIDSIKSKAKTEVINKLDTLTKGVISDSLKQKAKDVLDKKSSEEVDKIKEKLKDFNPFKKKGKG